MIRLLFTMASLMSLLLCGAMVWLLCRGRTTSDSAVWAETDAQGGTVCLIEVDSLKGLLVIFHGDNTFGRTGNRSWARTVSHDDASVMMPLMTYRFGVRPYVGCAGALSKWHNGESFVVFPTVAAAVLFAIAPAWSARLAVRRSKRCRTGCCRCCGYDLRGSSDCCPECGAEVWRSKRLA